MNELVVNSVSCCRVVVVVLCVCVFCRQDLCFAKNGWLGELAVIHVWLASMLETDVCMWKIAKYACGRCYWGGESVGTASTQCFCLAAQLLSC